ncbi:MAG: hypothetical protein J6K40_05580 [Alistipes sp.]|nr:hypothetical protein [Alistipes sp.]
MANIFQRVAEGIEAVVARVAVVVVVALSVAGCGRAELLEDILEAEAIAQEHPDQALAIMQSIDPNDLSTSKLRGHYALSYIITQYYNEIIPASDSLSNQAVGYFAKSTDHNRRARAYFHNGLINRAEQRVPEAMLSLMEAEKSVKMVDQPRLEGLILRAMGDIYMVNMLMPNALEIYHRSRDCFERAGLKHHAMYGTYNIACVEARMRNFDAAEKLFVEVRDYALETDSHDFLYMALYELGNLYMQLNRFEECEATLKLMEELNLEIFDMSQELCMRAMIASERGDRRKALEFIEEAEEQENSDPIITEYTRYRIHRRHNESDMALLYCESSIARQDSMTLRGLEHPVLNHQISQLQMTIESKEREASLRQQRNIAIFVSAIVLLVVVIVYIVSRLRQKNRDIANYMATINELQLMRHDDNDKAHRSAALTDAVDRLYNDRFVDLNRLCEAYYDHDNTSRQPAKVFEQVQQTIAQLKSDEVRIAKLEQIVNSCRGDIMTKLREQCPKLNERELRVSLYTYAGLSTRAICLFMDSNPVAISKVKYRIKSKIKESNAADMELLISGISDK